MESLEFMVEFLDFSPSNGDVFNDQEHGVDRFVASSRVDDFQKQRQAKLSMRTQEGEGEGLFNHLATEGDLHIAPVSRFQHSPKTPVAQSVNRPRSIPTPMVLA